MDHMIQKVYKLNDRGLWGVKFHDKTNAYWCVANKRAFEGYGLYPSHDKTKKQNEIQNAQKAELQSKFPDPATCPLFAYSDNENIRVLVDGSFKPFEHSMKYINSQPIQATIAEVL